jgi:hypothetical protein
MNDTFLPADLSDATGMSSVTGKFLSCNIFSMVLPTSPVAPTRATFMGANVNIIGANKIVKTVLVAQLCITVAVCGLITTFALYEEPGLAEQVFC